MLSTRPPDRRDFKGDWSDNANGIRWPHNHRLAVSVVVNVEEGAELSIADGDKSNESVYEIREEVEGAPDPCMESHFNYGPRRGYARIVDVLDQHQVPATFSTCGRAAQRLPWLLQDAVSRGHEVSAHGWRWERHANLTLSEEEKIINDTYVAIEAACGIAPVGWHTRSASSINTRQLVQGHGGFAYDSDAYDDDLPRCESINNQAHVIVPYAFDTNDMRFSPGGGFIHADDFSRYVIAAFDQLYAEGDKQLRMLSIGLHLRIIGRPARISALNMILEHITQHEHVWFATRRDIAVCFRTQSGLPTWTPSLQPPVE